MSLFASNQHQRRRLVNSISSQRFQSRRMVRCQGLHFTLHWRELLHRWAAWTCRGVLPAPPKHAVERSGQVCGAFLIKNQKITLKRLRCSMANPEVWFRASEAAPTAQEGAHRREALQTRACEHPGPAPTDAHRAWPREHRSDQVVCGFRRKRSKTYL